jgi:hypothetical protein
MKRTAYCKTCRVTVVPKRKDRIRACFIKGDYQAVRERYDACPNCGGEVK